MPHSALITNAVRCSNIKICKKQ